jgi:hypothetical protein
MILALLAAAVEAGRYQAEPQVLGPARRAVVVLASLVFFVSVALYAGLKLRRALLSRPKEPPARSFWS